MVFILFILIHFTIENKKLINFLWLMNNDAKKLYQVGQFDILVVLLLHRHVKIKSEVNHIMRVCKYDT